MLRAAQPGHRCRAGLPRRSASSSTVAPWGMVDVFMLGALVSLVKLTQLAKVHAGRRASTRSARYIVLRARRRCSAFEPHALWHRVDELRASARRAEGRRAHDAHRAARGPAGSATRASSCNRAPAGARSAACARCGARAARAPARQPQPHLGLPGRRRDPLHSRQPAAGDAHRLALRHRRPTPSCRGVVYLWTHRLVARSPSIVFVASIVVPLAKIALAVLPARASAQRRSTLAARSGARSSTARPHYIGRWSMVDIFVGAVLVALVQFRRVRDDRAGARRDLLRRGRRAHHARLASSFDPRAHLGRAAEAARG